MRFLEAGDAVILIRASVTDTVMRARLRKVKVTVNVTPGA
jgi:hypothetical protein